MARVLLIGYGNPGRGDDALGWSVAEALEKAGLEGLSVEVDYQLNVEDAFDVQGYDAVVFADASVSAPEPFEFKPITPADPATFTSHSVSPAGVLALARDLFGIRVQGWVLGVRGYEFDEFGAPLTPRAQANLRDAVAFLEARVRSGEWGAMAPA